MPLGQRYLPSAQCRPFRPGPGFRMARLVFRFRSLEEVEGSETVKALSGDANTGDF